jgi:hypothetical protein
VSGEGYDWDVSRPALERFFSLDSEERGGLLRLFDKWAASEGIRISDNAFELEGKPYHTVITGRHVVTFVYDHPVQMVHILAIE